MIGSFVKSTSAPNSTTSWHGASVTSFAGTGCSIASSSLGRSCSLVMLMLRQMSSFDETKPATTGIFDSFSFSNMMGFSPLAAMMPAISYSTETGFVIFVNSPVSLSCSMKPLNVKLVRLKPHFSRLLLKKQSQTYRFFLFMGMGYTGVSPSHLLVVDWFGFWFWAVFWLLLGWGVRVFRL